MGRISCKATNGLQFLAASDVPQRQPRLPLERIGTSLWTNLLLTTNIGCGSGKPVLAADKSGEYWIKKNQTMAGRSSRRSSLLQAASVEIIVSAEGVA